ncbi:hypothetical protein [Paenibacillus sp. GbtcB18]|uniref:hypothetical protein n=1 Tax=Paenibacillus sp. GbtcB18 TaxID=2824763 RepID=UPI001C3051CE|nr:hypothetical protein [Paenibacillus sp. GbtcB18]
MTGFIAQQPNGLYCRFSKTVDCPTHWNMTRDDYLNNVTGTVHTREMGEEILNYHVLPFSEVIIRFAPTNMSYEEFERLLVLMNQPQEGEAKK